MKSHPSRAAVIAAGASILALIISLSPGSLFALAGIGLALLAIAAFALAVMATALAIAAVRVAVRAPTA